MDPNTLSLRRSQFQCFLEENNTSDVTNAGSCPAVWDGLLCWNAQKNNSEILQFCPSYVADFIADGLAFKECEGHGSWFRHPASNWTWTNYTSCKKDVQQDKETVFVQFYLTICGYILSVGALILSLIIFTTFRSLQCQRVTIHKNLFASYIISALTSTAWLISTIHPPENAQFWCKALNAIFQYAVLCNYYWMLCEGIYLHSFAVTAVFRDEQSMSLFLVLGWGVPAIPTAIYVFERIFVDNLGCWTFVKTSMTHYIIHGPVFVALLINLGILLNLLKVLLDKLRSSPAGSRNEYEGFILAVRATLILVPLLGAHHVLLSLTVFINNTTARVVVDYIQIILNSLQGFTVALIFCFCHEEVLSKCRQVLSSHFSFQTRDRHQPRGATRKVRTQGSLIPTQTEGLSQVETML